MKPQGQLLLRHRGGGARQIGERDQLEAFLQKLFVCDWPHRVLRTRQRGVVRSITLALQMGNQFIGRPKQVESEFLWQCTVHTQ